MSTEVVSSIRAAVCRVSCADISSSGTAFVVDETGYLVTANHVVSKVELQAGAIVSNYSTDISVRIGSDTYPATIVNDQSEPAPLVHDYAILKIDPQSKLSSVEIHPYEDISQGDEVICAGFPLNFDELVVSRGIVSALVRHPSIYNSLQIVDSIVTDAVMQFGSSGGPLVSAETGKVMGINTRKHDQLDEMQVLYIQAKNSLPENDALRRLIECTYKFRHLGFHHANAAHYVTRDPAYPNKEDS